MFMNAWLILALMTSSTLPVPVILVILCVASEIVTSLYAMSVA
jgi:hypothetical protein